MDDTPETKFINYADMMLLNIADELNVKEIRLKIADKPEISVVYRYDTINGESEGYTVEVDKKAREAPKTKLIGLTAFLTGDVRRDMQKVRAIVSEGLRQRGKAGVKVRQPLQAVTIIVNEAVGF